MNRFGAAALFVATLLVAAVPAWAEQAAVDALGGPCTGRRCLRMDGATVDARGIRLDGVRGNLGPVAFTGVRARASVDDTGLVVDVEGLRATAQVESPSPLAAERGPEKGSTPKSGSASPLKSGLDRLDGIPITVRTQGHVVLSVAGVQAEIRDFWGRRDADGSLRARGQLAAEARGVRVQSLGPLEVRPDSNGAEIRGRLQVGDGTPTRVLAHAQPGSLRAMVAPAEGGQAEIQVGLDGLRPTHATIDAHDLALDALQDYTDRLPAGLEVSLHTSRLDGRLRVQEHRFVTGRRVELELNGARIRGLSLQSAALAREPVNLRPLELRGQIALANRGLETHLTVEHGALAARVEGTFSPRDADLRVDLRPLSCQALLDSMPEGFLPMLRGMKLDGELDGGLHVKYARDQVIAHVAKVADYGDYQPPGELELRLPVLEACTILEDPAEIDFEALRGPYRHRYLTDAGTERQLLLAPGSPGFVSLDEIGLVADAFTTLEDSRFWDHDGFDRAQMERAFWFNLAQGRVRRGASTITQQIARNLWLGHRSLHLTQTPRSDLGVAHGTGSRQAPHLGAVPQRDRARSRGARGGRRGPLPFRPGRPQSPPAAGGSPGLDGPGTPAVQPTICGRHDRPPVARRSA